jgi:hypothetical protein
MPASAALGMLLWLAGWTWFLVHYYIITQDNTFTVRTAAALALLAFFLVRVNNWARMIALMANAMAILFLSAWAFIHFQSSGIAGLVVNAANLVILLAASYYLLIAPTTRFFKAHGHSGGGSTDQS